MVRVSRRLAWIASCVGLVLAIAPGIISFARDRQATYDGSLAVLTATLIAVVWYTEFTFEALHHARTQADVERKRARTAIATGLLEELKWLDGILAQIYTHGPNSFYDPLAHPMFEAAIAQSALFEPATLEALSAFHALLRDCRATMNEYRLRGSSTGADTKAEYVRFTKAKAAFALAKVQVLVECLKAEGGVRTDRALDGGWNHEGLPALPASSFGRRYGE